MKIALFHYHLKPGGVTTVIKKQIEVLKDDCEILIISGEEPKNSRTESNDFKNIPVIIIPELAYCEKQFSLNEVKSIAKKIHNSCLEKIGGCDIFHAHNQKKKKNINLLKVLNELHNLGFRLFLQIHDFAEDGRTISYYFEDYPTHCHYGVINSRDYIILLNAGMKPEGLHKISNTIRPFENLPSIKSKPDKNYIHYPVRAIRRKNIGEIVLLSQFLEKTDQLAIGLPPTSPKDFPYYESWKNFCRENHANVLFEASYAIPFLQLVAMAKMMITTSITEGFGFSFLEPWTANKVLCGRKIPDICIDFEEQGINFDHLYTRFAIPFTLLDKKKFFEKWKKATLWNTHLFYFSIKKNDMEKAFHELTMDNAIDFGLLDKETQQSIIQKIIKSKLNKDMLLEKNPFILSLFDTNNKEDLIKKNKKIIQSYFTNDRYRKMLLRIYKKVQAMDVTHEINKQTILRNFFNLNNFSLLKWEFYA